MEAMFMCTCGKLHSSRRRLLGGMAALAAFGSLHPAAAMAPEGGSLRRGAGEITINGRPAQAGSAVAAGDTIAAGPGSQAVFTLGDDAFLLRAEGAVTVSDGPDGRRIDLESGRLLSAFGPKRITLRTPLANVGIRGTAVYLESRPAATDICVCYGHAVLVPTDDSGKAEEVRTRHHDAPRRVFGSGRRPAMEPYMVVNHTDEELAMLEALVGRTPPFMPR